MRPPTKSPSTYKGQTMAGSGGSKWKSIRTVFSRQYEWVCFNEDRCTGNAMNCIWKDWCPTSDVRTYPTPSELAALSTAEIRAKFVLPQNFPGDMGKADLIEFITILKPLVKY